MNAHHDFKEGNKAAKKMFCILLIALIPLFIILGIYLNDPRSPILHSISTSTHNLPAILSSKNLLLSKVMDVYTKTAPLFAIIFFSTSYKKLKLKDGQSAWHILSLHVLFTAFYLALIYSFLFTNTELTSSERMLKVISSNDFTLSLFFILLYTGIYIFSCLYLWLFSGMYRAFKERR